MKNCAKKSLKTLSSLFAASLLFCFSSCEIGLGATVDVEKPTVSITYPPTSSIIRDSFILAGTCSDDRELKSIEVEIVKNKNGKEIFVSKTVYEDIITLKGDGTAKNATWKVELNTPVDGKYPLTDGKYTFKVKSFDATNRESMQSSRTVEIDNTAPVFVIKNPGSIDDVESYGSIFTLKGVIKEEHTISYMKLIVYNENKQDITSVLNGTTAEWIENDVEEDVNIIVARFNTDVEDNLHERYASIYGTESAGIKNYYISIIVGDNAGVYKTENYDDSDVSSDPTDDEFTGNHTSVGSLETSESS